MLFRKVVSGGIGPGWWLGFLCLTASDVARADVGPQARCQTEGLGCQECGQMGHTPEGDATFEQCARQARERGLSEACDHRQGAYLATFFCPSGVRVPQATSAPAGGQFAGGSSGCASCSVVAPVATRGSTVLGLLLGGTLAAGWRRHSSARRSEAS